MLKPSFSIDTPDTVTGIFVSPNEQYIAIGYGNKKIRIYDLENQETKKDIEGCCYSVLDENVINVAFSPDSS